MGPSGYSTAKAYLPHDCSFCEGGEGLFSHYGRMATGGDTVSRLPSESFQENGFGISQPHGARSHQLLQTEVLPSEKVLVSQGDGYLVVRPARQMEVVFAGPVKSSFLPQNDATGNRNRSRPIQILRDRNRTALDRSFSVHNAKKTGPDRLRPVFC
ncbi:uncharacterized protein LACBIDRAFT_311355 [Laccaria bicolor S238N-H82]|uniref:Predicted protein n=1 Tax=Laccaria bicolor (strain S238N-H82 / ATCC MYA-4686) TaxID=486041 RepID=B0CZT9_LACBS|nr:uncharacterized protein LACBIDRAFT_311355 [Laccaria bicolor S238N-H82]EDR12674.1 predicted protein [Laccaria bicolor S238N-H82]|eukprot:XP_001876938.1 predicted protein [Laccaria bicolor S238N-H82]